MKKIFILLLTIASVSSTLRAQENITDVRDRLLFGVKIGGNYSNIYASSGEELQTNPKLGFAAGAFLSIPIGRYLGIQPEVLFSQKGFHATGRFIGDTYDLTRTTDFLDIPLLFAFKPSEFLTILAGPQYSYLMKQTDVFTNGTTSILQEQQFENENPRKNILCFTLGADLNLKRVVIGARVGWDIQNNNGDGSSTTPKYKNVWYQGTIGYRFY
jgi:hypothetical protein